MRLLFYTLIGIALGWWEAVVVVYIREILMNISPDITKITISQLLKPLMVTGERKFSLIFVERTREIAPIFIIFSISLFSEKRIIKKLATFFWIFAIWDLTYYLTLKILINWPSSLKTIDCLFLIPKPWIAPVYVPISIMLLFLIFSGYIFKKIK
jgi:hypothetical protein